MRGKFAAAALALLLATVLAYPATAAEAYAPRFEPAACPALPVAALANARCGYLVVPEDRRRPAGRTLRLVAAIVPARSARPAADPVVYMAGGPGGIALLEADLAVAAGLNRDRDLVLMNQRGTYLSQPALTCAAVDAFARRSIGSRFYAAATLRAHLAATRACLRSLQATGANLAAYNSSANAADFADLRIALGYEHWNVAGVSYGSYLAQVYMRDRPAGVRSVSLDSVIPLGTVTLQRFWDSAREGFDNLFQACASQPACRRAHPDLSATFTRLVRELEARPLRLTTNDPATGEVVAVVLDGGALVDWLRNQSYTTLAFRRVPELIAGLAARRPDAMQVIAANRLAGAPSAGHDVPAVGYGLAYGVVCREWAGSGEPGEIRRAGKRAFPLYPATIQREAVGTWAYVNEDCQRVWPVPRASRAMRQPVRSPVPTLLISGSFDAVASPAWAKAAATGLRKATAVVIAGAGHFVAPGAPCAQAVIASFLADPAGPDTSCANALAPPDFSSATAP
jgi:pimeloyl-ACP methyl ester carboxylesterase